SDLALESKTHEELPQNYPIRNYPNTQSILVGLGRIELPTSPLSGVRSSQLSYRPIDSRVPQRSAASPSPRLAPDSARRRLTRACGSQPLPAVHRKTFRGRVERARPPKADADHRCKTKAKRGSSEAPSAPRSGQRGRGVHGNIPRPIPFGDHRGCGDGHECHDVLSYKGGDPAAGSPTATLLRLHPNHELYLGRLLPCG